MDLTPDDPLPIPRGSHPDAEGVPVKIVTLDCEYLQEQSLMKTIGGLNDQIAATMASQKTLTSSITGLSEFLREFAEADEPFDVAAYTRKLIDSQNRLDRITPRMTSLTERLGTLQRSIAREVHSAKQEITQQNPCDKPER